MHPINALLHKFFAVRSLAGRVLRWLMYLAAFLFGLLFIGPFLTSAVYKSLLDQVAANPLLGYLLDPEDWILDQFIRNLAILLAVWTCAFAAYCRFKDRVKDLNLYFGYASFLTRGVGTFLIALFMLFAGIGMYPVLVLREGPAGIQIALLALVGFGLPGLFFSYYGKVDFKPNRLLDVVAPYAAVLCGLLTVAAMIYGATANVVGLARFILKHG
jgi:hypothetical protein